MADKLTKSLCDISNHVSSKDVGNQTQADNNSIAILNHFCQLQEIKIKITLLRTLCSTVFVSGMNLKEIKISFIRDLAGPYLRPIMSPFLIKYLVVFSANTKL